MNWGLSLTVLVGFSLQPLEGGGKVPCVDQLMGTVLIRLSRVHRILERSGPMSTFHMRKKCPC